MWQQRTTHKRCHQTPARHTYARVSKDAEDPQAKAGVATWLKHIEDCETETLQIRKCNVSSM